MSKSQVDVASEFSEVIPDVVADEDTIDPARIGAFFDVDETLVRGASIYWAAKEMFRFSPFGLREVAYAAAETFAYMLFGENQDKIDDFSTRAAQIVAGNSVEDMAKIGELIYEKYFVPKVYQVTYALLKQHVDAGHTVYLISATPWIIAEEFAHRLGAMGGIGTKTKVEDGIILGELEGGIVHGQAKVDAVLEVAEEKNLDLEKSWAYSDSSSDIPMLSTVGHPVAVNPDRALRHHAKANGWQIVRAYERRDLALRWAGRAAVAALATGGAYLVFQSGKKGSRKAFGRKS